MYLRYTQPVFQSSSTIQIKNENSASKIIKIENPYDNDNISAEVEILRSKEFLKTILKKLPLKVSYYTEGEILTYENYRSSPYLVKANILDSSIYGTPIYIEFKDQFHAIITYTNSLQQKVSDEFDISYTVKLPEVELDISVKNFENLKDVKQELNDNYFFVLNSNSQLVNKYYNKIELKVLNEEANTVSIGFKDFNALKVADLSNTVANGYIIYKLKVYCICYRG